MAIELISVTKGVEVVTSLADALHIVQDRGTLITRLGIDLHLVIGIKHGSDRSGIGLCRHGAGKGGAGGSRDEKSRQQRLGNESD